MFQKGRKAKRRARAVGKVEGVCVRACVLVGMVVQASGLQMGSDSVPLAVSCPQAALHQWPHYPGKHTCTDKLSSGGEILHPFKHHHCFLKKRTVSIFNADQIIYLHVPRITDVYQRYPDHCHHHQGQAD